MLEVCCTTWPLYSINPIIQVSVLKEYEIEKRYNQGTNARKVIYAFFVLQCTVFGRKSKHKTDVAA